MPNPRSWIHQCCRRLNRGVVLKVAAEWLAVWLCLFGTVVIVVKRAWPQMWPYVLWGAATAIPLLYFARKRALEARFLAGDGAALLDDRLGTHGLLMTVSERPDPAWGQLLPRDEAVWAAALPRVRPVRFAKIVLLPAAFLGIALSLPAKELPRDAGRNQRPRLKAVTQLPRMLDELKQANVLDPDEHKFLKEEIDKVVDQTAKAPPNAEQWRKIDELRARLRQRLNAEARAMKKGRQAVERLERAAKSPDRKLTQAELKQLENDLNAALARIGKHKSPSKTGPKPKTAKTTSPKIAAKSPAKKTTGNPQPPAKTAPRVAGKTGAGKTIAKTSTPTKTTVAKTTPKKTGGVGKVAAMTGGVATSKKTGKRIAKTSPKKQPGKTGRPAVAGKSPGGKSKSPKQKVAGKKPKPKQKTPTKIPPVNPRQLEKLAKLLQFVDKIPPGLQAEIERRLMEMARSGQLRIPDDPELRKQLMRQARKLLEQNADKLEDLQRRFGHLARNLPRPDRNRTPRSPGVGKTGSGKTGSRKTGAGNAASKVAFRDVVLPPGLTDLKQSRVERVVGKTPKVAPVRPSVIVNGNGKLEPSRWQSWKRNYPPRYRALLKQYFESGRKQ